MYYANYIANSEISIQDIKLSKMNLRVKDAYLTFSKIHSMKCVNAHQTVGSFRLQKALILLLQSFKYNTKIKHPPNGGMNKQL